MMKDKDGVVTDTLPTYGAKAFICPWCGAYSHQYWNALAFASIKEAGMELDVTRSNYLWRKVDSLEANHCACCGAFSLWHMKTMIYPTLLQGLAPNPDLPRKIKDDYEEARSIAPMSPRGAAALLRLAIQKLCVHLGCKGENLNEDIGRLVKNGLPMKIQKALDYVRVIGNNAVHPGQVDIQDDTKAVDNLFHLINLIAEAMITQPNHVKALYDSLPDSAKKQVAERDRSLK